jgi:hypothetical protein
MRRNLSVKVYLSGVLATLLILNAAGAAKSVDDRYIPQDLVRNEAAAIQSYDQLLGRYVKDCDRSGGNSRLSGERLQQCLAAAKQLRDQFPDLRRNAEAVPAKIKNSKKWTPELDEDFEKKNLRRNPDAEFANDVRQAGGFRKAYESNLAKLDLVKRDIDKEISELESLSKRASVFHSQFIKKTSFTARAVMYCPYGYPKCIVYKLSALSKGLS